MSDNRIRLFEGDVLLRGKHSAYVKFLVNDAKIFDKYIDVYLCGAVVGYLYNVKAPRDNSIQDTGKIYADTLSKHKQDRMFLYRLITLLDGAKSDEKECINRAFRYDTDNGKAEETMECLERFNAYARGGIEKLYEDLKSGATNRRDYIKNSIDYAKKFKDELDDSGVSYKEKLKREISGGRNI